MTKRRRLGQHYLIDPEVVRLIIETSAIKPGERVVEIGTGRGVLTRRLCEISGNVEAFEVDRVNYLATKRRVTGGLNIHLGDAFKARPKFDVLVSSLPYSESSRFVEWLSQRSYDRAVVLLQSDFVEKLVSKPHRPTYRAMSVIFQISSYLRIVASIGRDAFYPPPRVSSVVVMIRPRTTLRVSQIKLVKALFSQKKRKLEVALKKLGLGVEIAPEKLWKRVWELSPVELQNIVDSCKPYEQVGSQPVRFEAH